jgi:hypothetical protein
MSQAVILSEAKDLIASWNYKILRPACGGTQDDKASFFDFLRSIFIDNSKTLSMMLWHLLTVSK